MYMFKLLQDGSLVSGREKRLYNPSAGLKQLYIFEKGVNRRYDIVDLSDPSPYCYDSGISVGSSVGISVT